MNNTCPIPLAHGQIITHAHGSGGQATHQLLEDIFLPAFGNEQLNLLHDGAFLQLPKSEVVFTTDSFVVQPIFFPGGDIGKLAIVGTANDLAMCGAKPHSLSAAFILEEGLPIEDLRKVVDSMRVEALALALQIVAGDTKVIEKKGVSGLLINTCGIGISISPAPIHPRQIQEGDAMILSGDIGRHGMAIMAIREHMEFSNPLFSDCASLFPLVEALLAEKIEIHAMRDLTRGGLATALVEIAESARKELLLQESAIPISREVDSACEILGFDPLYVACEGRFIAFIPKSQVEQALFILRQFPEATNACCVGYVAPHSNNPKVHVKNAFGIERPLYRLAGELLPRIC